jgi:hypothetical protein
MVPPARGARTSGAGCPRPSALCPSPLSTLLVPRGCGRGGNRRRRGPEGRR